jgi:hypothetical protein
MQQESSFVVIKAYLQFGVNDESLNEMLFVIEPDSVFVCWLWLMGIMCLHCISGCWLESMHIMRWNLDVFLIDLNLSAFSRATDRQKGR